MEVNYRTVSANLEAGRLSRRMRAAVHRFEDEAAEADAEAEAAGPAGAEVDEEQASVAEMSVEALTGEVRQLRETVQAQPVQLEELGRRVAEMEEVRAERAEGGEVHREEAEDGPASDDATTSGEWRPPKRAHGLPDAGVVMLEQQPDEEHAFRAGCEACGRVAGTEDWRDRAGQHGGQGESRGASLGTGSAVD